MAQQARLSTFIEELRRRRVFRVAAFYGGIAFVIVQIIDGALEVASRIRQPSKWSQFSHTRQFCQ